MISLLINHFPDIVQILLALSALIAGVWAIFRFVIFREDKFWLEFDIVAEYKRIKNKVNCEKYFWEKNIDEIKIEKKDVSYFIETTLRITNKGKTRVRIYNMQIAIKTMNNTGDLLFSKEDGRIKLKTIHRSGNLVPEMHIKGKDINKTSFYYIEPGVKQEIHYVTLIEEPFEILQVEGKFNLSKKRLPIKDIQNDRSLYPHTATKIYLITSQCSENQQSKTS
jgi:hypothetical protein